DDDGECIWKFVKELPLPKSAFFQDYADIALHKDGKTVAIVSQEEAAIWVGGLDTEKWEFVDTPGMIYHFPRSIDCEGVTFLDGNRILTTSDAAKSSQSYNCVEKAQSVQVRRRKPLGQKSISVRVCWLFAKSGRFVVQILERRSSTATGSSKRRRASRRHHSRRGTLALSQSIGAHQFASPKLFSAPKLTDLYRKPSMST
ncbi:hypothetical protein T484DRAFT_1614610, partial [Baffinella frigidus]